MSEAFQSWLLSHDSYSKPGLIDVYIVCNEYSMLHSHKLKKYGFKLQHRCDIDVWEMMCTSLHDMEKFVSKIHPTSFVVCFKQQTGICYLFEESLTSHVKSHYL